MSILNPQVDVYIESAPDFAKPILVYFRALVHQVCPDTEEKMKWGVPHFDYKGMMCAIAAFKKHCAINFWKDSLIPGLQDAGNGKEKAMGQLGRITNLESLPKEAELVYFIQEAMRLNDEGIKIVPAKKAQQAKPMIPAYFEELLAEDEQIETTFKRMSPSHQKAYVEWFEEAKTEATRTKRMQTALEWIKEGKSRHWKYER